MRNIARSTPINTDAGGLHYSWDWHGIPVFNAATVKKDGMYHVFNLRDGIITVAEKSPKGWGNVWMMKYLREFEY